MGFMGYGASHIYVLWVHVPCERALETQNCITEYEFLKRWVMTETTVVIYRKRYESIGHPLVLQASDSPSKACLLVRVRRST
jgi:hypothetical protein